MTVEPTSETTPAMREDDPMRRSGAVWCEEHGRWECSKTSKQTKQRCHESAIRGRDVGRMHAGRSAALEKAVGQAALAAWSTEHAAADAPPLDPGTVVLQQLRVAVMRADLLGELLRTQVEWESEPGAELAGLVGRTFAAGRDGQRVETGEKVRALAAEERLWRDRAVSYAKAAHDMGIAERHVELEQERASLVTAAFRAALMVLDLLPADRDLAVRTFLSSLGAGEVAAGEVAG